MAEKEITLMKGNEAIAHAAIRCGCDGYFGYPITPQSEVLGRFGDIQPRGYLRNNERDEYFEYGRVHRRRFRTVGEPRRVAFV